MQREYCSRLTSGNTCTFNRRYICSVFYNIYSFLHKRSVECEFSGRQRTVMKAEDWYIEWQVLYTGQVSSDLKLTKLLLHIKTLKDSGTTLAITNEMCVSASLISAPILMNRHKGRARLSVSVLSPKQTLYETSRDMKWLSICKIKSEWYSFNHSFKQALS